MGGFCDGRTYGFERMTWRKLAFTGMLHHDMVVVVGRARSFGGILFDTHWYGSEARID